MNMPIETAAAIDSTNTKNRKRRVLLFSLLALAAGAAGGGGWIYWEQIGSRYVSTDNAYTAAEIAVVTAEIEGLAAEVRVVDSQKVKRGDILVVIDDTDTKLALRQSEADLARAKAQIASAKAQIASAKANQERSGIDLKRREALVGSGSVSGDELTQVKNGATNANAALDNAQAALDAAQAAEALAQARLEKTKVDLGRTVIRAPVDGVVARRQVQLGQRVQPATPLLNVAPVQEMYVNANFKEVQLKDVQPGQAVELVCDLYGEHVAFHGVVDGFNGGTGAAFALIPAQNATGNWIKVVQRLPVRVRLDPAELAAHPLRVGLSMTAKIDLRSKS